MTRALSASPHFKPRLTRLLRALGLDVVYERCDGCFLYYRSDCGEEVPVLDLAGGYGSVLLGHNHPALIAEAVRQLTEGRPVHAQGSRRPYAERLAAELSRRAGGDYCVHFANSGTEAVEAAVKHAMLETGARRFIALEHAFHGLTLGALQLTGSATYRAPFGMAAPDVVRVRPNDLDVLDAAFEGAGDLAGLIFEPILGEGGVLPIEAAFAQRAAAHCAARGIPLIADECQTGCGRTGTFLASERLGVHPDYVVLSKALGGGVAKIAAVLIARRRHVDDFDLLHTSTYADDDLSCAVALRTLELVDEAALAGCAAKGTRLIAELQRLRDHFPDVIAEVRGAGLMIGVEFRRLASSPSVVLRSLSAQEDLGYLLAAYLLARHRIRVAPTLGSAFTLRLEPSLPIAEAEADRVAGALEELCERLRRHDAVSLTAVVRGTGDTRASARPPRSTPTPVFFLRARDRTDAQPPGSQPRVAWLFHLVDGDDLASLDAEFAHLPPEQREDLLARFSALATPIVMSATDIASRSGGRVRLYPVLLPFTSRWARQAIDARQLALPRALVQQGVDVAHALGCRVVSLGQYTSIVTGHGTRLAAHGMAMTTGNGYSVALAVEAIEQAHAARGLEPDRSTLAIAGAAGNIGRACAAILAPRYRRVLLVGSARQGSLRRLQHVARDLPGSPMVADRAALPHADVVVIAVNDVASPFGPDDFAQGAIVCDLSIPAAVHRTTRVLRPDLRVIDGGIAQLPFGEDLQIEGFPLPRGQVYGCLAEAILLGLDGPGDAALTGRVTAAHVARMTALASRHGFALADDRLPARAGASSRSRAT